MLRTACCAPNARCRVLACVDKAAPCWATRRLPWAALRDCLLPEQHIGPPQPPSRPLSLSPAPAPPSGADGHDDREGHARAPAGEGAVPTRAGLNAGLPMQARPGACASPGHAARNAPSSLQRGRSWPPRSARQGKVQFHRALVPPPSLPCPAVRAHRAWWSSCCSRGPAAWRRRCGAVCSKCGARRSVGRGLVPAAVPPAAWRLPATCGGAAGASGGGLGGHGLPQRQRCRGCARQADVSQV